MDYVWAGIHTMWFMWWIKIGLSQLLLRPRCGNFTAWLVRTEEGSEDLVEAIPGLVSKGRSGVSGGNPLLSQFDLLAAIPLRHVGRQFRWFSAAVIKAPWFLGCHFCCTDHSRSAKPPVSTDEFQHVITWFGPWTSNINHGLSRRSQQVEDIPSPSALYNSVSVEGSWIRKHRLDLGTTQHLQDSLWVFAHVFVLVGWMQWYMFITFHTLLEHVFNVWSAPFFLSLLNSSAHNKPWIWDLDNHWTWSSCDSHIWSCSPTRSVTSQLWLVQTDIIKGLRVWAIVGFLWFQLQLI